MFHHHAKYLFRKAAAAIVLLHKSKILTTEKKRCTSVLTFYSYTIYVLFSQCYVIHAVARVWQSRKFNYTGWKILFEVTGT